MSHARPEAQHEPGTHERSATVIGRGFSFRLGTQAVSAIINVANMVMLGGYLAAQGYGQYAFYYALVPLIASMSDLGVGVIITREVARDRSLGPRLLGDAILLKATVSAVLLLLVSLTAPHLLDPAAALLLVIVTAAALVEVGQDVGVWQFRAHDRQDLEGLVLVLEQVLRLGGIAVCAAFKLPVAYAIGASAVAFALRAAISGGLLARLLYPPVFAPDWGRIRSLIVQGLPFGLAMFTVVLYGRVGVLMLKGLATNDEVAFYNIGYMLAQPLGFLSSALSISAFPAFSRRAKLDPEGIGRVLRRTVKYQIVMAVPIAVGLAIMAERVIQFLFHGGGFVEAGGALRVISLGLPLVFLNLTARYMLTALDAQRAYLSAIVVGLMVNVGLSAAFAAPLGATGAAVGLLAGELAVFLVCQRTLRRHVGVGPVLAELGRPALAALVMGLVVFALRSAPLWIVPVVGSVVYAGMLFALRVFGRDELRVLRGVYVSFGLPGSAYLMKVRNSS